tara:strand:+ start:2097 stop:3272 length:1176 start_codon:yes stop_codon:yes gene_type:complete
MGPPTARGRGAAGRGRGRGGAPQQVDDDSTTRYERISLLAAEIQGCATGGDGADSALFSEDGGGDSGDEDPRRRDEDDDDDSYEDPEDAEARDADGMSAMTSSDDDGGGAGGGGGGGGGGRPPPARKNVKRQKKDRVNSKSGPVSASDMMTAAAFGGKARVPGEDTSDDDESLVSRTNSKRKRDAYCHAFPVKGVTCVGCALANRIGPVERFVMANVGRQSEHALWKFASLTWKKDVVEPARKEGVHVVDWPWRDIANHFRLHTTSAVVGRTAMINTLTAMRCQVEAVLVRNDNGERTLDKNNAELALKVDETQARPTTRPPCIRLLMIRHGRFCADPGGREPRASAPPSRPPRSPRARLCYLTEASGWRRIEPLRGMEEGNDNEICVFFL